MKRARKPAAPAPSGIAPELRDLAKERLEQDYLGFISGTSTEDPKLYIARSAAAREALEHLAQLRILSGEPPVGEEAEPTPDELLAAMRAGIALENKT
ncbi:hypothetical protein [Falsiroseomonas oryzae]|uniref:hypothetical protein n=1 Tax=Falsiroseomonas oryzae TaxID=2766473 RepID=UPI0022EA8E07|nr:hypothetical protein [Roseomonas sp. MO-31]